MALSERRIFLDRVDTVTEFAKDISGFPKSSSLTESKAFVGPLVEGIAVSTRQATVAYTIPTPDDSRPNVEIVTATGLGTRILSTVRCGRPMRRRRRRRSPRRRRRAFSWSWENLPSSWAKWAACREGLTGGLGGRRLRHHRRPPAPGGTPVSVQRPAQLRYHPELGLAGAAGLAS